MRRDGNPGCVCGPGAWLETSGGILREESSSKRAVNSTEVLSHFFSRHLTSQGL